MSRSHPEQGQQTSVGTSAALLSTSVPVALRWIGQRRLHLELRPSHVELGSKLLVYGNHDSTVTIPVHGGLDAVAIRGEQPIHLVCYLLDMTHPVLVDLKGFPDEPQHGDRV